MKRFEKSGLVEDLTAWKHSYNDRWQENIDLIGLSVVEEPNMSNSRSL